jgi:hypothetical protein
VVCRLSAALRHANHKLQNETALLCALQKGRCALHYCNLLAGKLWVMRTLVIFFY